MRPKLPLGSTRRANEFSSVLARQTQFTCWIKINITVHALKLSREIITVAHTIPFSISSSTFSFASSNNSFAFFLAS